MEARFQVETATVGTQRFFINRLHRLRYKDLQEQQQEERSVLAPQKPTCPVPAWTGGQSGSAVLPQKHTHDALAAPGQRQQVVSGVRSEALLPAWNVSACPPCPCSGIPSVLLWNP